MNTSFDTPKKRKSPNETRVVINLCDSEDEELNIPQFSQLPNVHNPIPSPSPKSNPLDSYIYDHLDMDSKVPPEKEVIDLTVDVQGQPKDDSAYLPSDDSDVPRHTARIRMVIDDLMI